jgi:hypothetical protein
MTLVSRRASGRGWGHFQTGQISVEATCLASLALAGMLNARSVGANEALMRLQNGNGSWPAFAGDHYGCWTTALAMIVVGFYGGSRNIVERGARFLIATKGYEAHWLWRWKFKLADTQARFDPDKYGWPWLPGAGSWVIPTAFALIALKQFVSCTPSETARQRIRTGVEMLFDRACLGGGWNAGNSVVYGAPLTPHVEPTAIALMALQDEPPNEIIRDSLAWLKRQTQNLAAISSLAWSILSLFLYGVPVGELKRRLADRTGDGSQIRDNAVLAVAALALQCGDMIHPFALIR